VQISGILLCNIQIFWGAKILYSVCGYRDKALVGIAVIVGTGHALSLRMPCPYACPVPTHALSLRQPPAQPGNLLVVTIKTAIMVYHLLSHPAGVLVIMGVYPYSIGIAPRWGDGKKDLYDGKFPGIDFKITNKTPILKPRYITPLP